MNSTADDRTNLSSACESTNAEILYECLGSRTMHQPRRPGRHRYHRPFSYLQDLSTARRHLDRLHPRRHLLLLRRLNRCITFDLSHLCLRLSLQLPPRHGNRDIKGILHTRHTRHPLPHNIKPRPMGWRGNRQWQPALHRHTPLEGKKLHRDLALVVVHCHDAVKVITFEEDGVAGEGALDVDAFLLGAEDGWADGGDFLGAERAVFAVVWIESADAEAWRVDA